MHKLESFISDIKLDTLESIELSFYGQGKVFHRFNMEVDLKTIIAIYNLLKHEQSKKRSKRKISI
jgi:hypothetical protein